MNAYRNRGVRLAAILGMLAVPLACDDFLDVPDPTVIDAGTIDPVNDLPTFAISALQDLFSALDDVIVYSAWFSGEAWVGDTFPTRNDIGRRVVEYTNGTLNGDIYQPLAFAISTNERVLELYEESGIDNAEILTMANLGAGWAILLQAENFCQVVISSGLHNLGPGLTSAEGMARAIEHFDADAIAGAQLVVLVVRVEPAGADHRLLVERVRLPGGHDDDGGLVHRRRGDDALADLASRPLGGGGLCHHAFSSVSASAAAISRARSSVSSRATSLRTWPMRA